MRSIIVFSLLQMPNHDFITQLPHKVLPFTDSETFANQAKNLHLASCIALEKRGKENNFHWQNRKRTEGFCFLKYTVEGTGYLKNEETGEVSAIPPGHAFLIPLPSPTTYYSEEGKPWTFLWMNFIGEPASTLCRELCSKYGYLYDLNEYPAVLVVLTELYQYRLENPQYDFYHVSALVYKVLMLLYQYHEAFAPSLPTSIQKACDYMINSIGNPNLSIEEIASKVGYSKFHFTRKFKEHMKRSPHQYLIKIRLEKAVELISTTDLPIKIVSERVGFREISHFYNVFKKHLKITPGSLNRPTH